METEIQYVGQDFKWGYEIGESGLRHQWFKLDLDPSQHREGQSLAITYPDPLASPPGYDVTPTKLVTDYLTAIRNHAELVLRHKLPRAIIDATPIEYLITVPAVWSGAAQAKTRACVQNAGMGTGSTLHIISEPEAAAIYALESLAPHNIKVDDTFMLLNAGGGTCDLISYMVSALKPILTIKEANPRSGSLCGSSFLNRIFRKLLKDRFEKDPLWDDDVPEEASSRGFFKFFNTNVSLGDQAV